MYVGENWSWSSDLCSNSLTTDGISRTCKCILRNLNMCLQGCIQTSLLIRIKLLSYPQWMKQKIKIHESLLWRLGFFCYQWKPTTEGVPRLFCCSGDSTLCPRDGVSKQMEIKARFLVLDITINWRARFQKLGSNPG